MEDKFFTVNELSKYLNVKGKTIYSWVSKSVIPFYKLQGVIRFKKVEIDFWLKNKCKKFEGLFGL
ncbi:MAG: helix-turn-helix domain-containing protein [Nitrospina sp.]|jgi:excisionase family DNA binding protein|nr:helix-turn-helix domain-containing protein [Nitrospina sp.]MBT3875492.1 helix-turn-helix domain-containing protein [Nitrospina sp.]MBT4375689.1 helix-turn-helix domain-containing protein [Nitrospina sp.]MBT4557731.1 helix-turn-helix domain-containing protein [Nitrospina sp.]MBT6741269.1 helix-turn-helix domain-containing protein [Nitrospina sp.]